MSKAYRCASCGKVFESAWTTEDAEAEYRALFPGSVAAGDPREVVCDVCFKRMTSEYPPALYEAQRNAPNN